MKMFWKRIITNPVVFFSKSKKLEEIPRTLIKQGHV